LVISKKLLVLRPVLTILKIITMKKFFAILAIAGAMTACNNAAQNTEANADSAKVAAAADSAKAAADTLKAAADTAKAAADTLKAKVDSLKK
jgi:hypothetical protein